MSNIKLQVGEDYLNGLFETIHIQSYNNVSYTYKDTKDNEYNLLGQRFFQLHQESHSYHLKTDSKYNLVTHLPKVSKEPSDEDILKAGISFTYSKFPGIDKEVDETLVMSGWKAAIEWYKQQIK